MFDKCFTWLFNEEELKPIAFITVLGMIILISTVISLFILSVSRHIEWI